MCGSLTRESIHLVTNEIKMAMLTTDTLNTGNNNVTNTNVNITHIYTKLTGSPRVTTP